MSEAVIQASQTGEEAYNPAAHVEVLSETTLQLQPCCLEFSPNNPELLVIGTYNLEDPTTQSRNGSILLYQLHDQHLTLLDNVTHPSGILDLHFNRVSRTGENFAVASSTGSISIFKIESDSRYSVAQIVRLHTFQIFPESVLVLSLAWHSSPDGPIAVSSSSGQVGILNIRDDLTILSDIACVNTHQDNAAWTVAFSINESRSQMTQDPSSDRESETKIPGEDSQPLSPIQGIYSGGDDGRLRFATFSRNEEGRTVPEPTYHVQPGGTIGMGGHNAGVTAILPLPLPTNLGEDILVTGSYDDYVRVYAMYDHRPEQANKKPKILAELKIGGGVWRLKFLRDYTINLNTGRREHIDRDPPIHTFRILASCMQAGARILEVKGSQYGEWTIKVLAVFKFDTRNILNYAGDVQPAGFSSDLDERKVVCVSANFYEKQLCVWSFTTL